jgi:hypothetical protein
MVLIQRTGVKSGTYFKIYSYYMRFEASKKIKFLPFQHGKVMPIIVPQLQGLVMSSENSYFNKHRSPELKGNLVKLFPHSQIVVMVQYNEQPQEGTQ